MNSPSGGMSEPRRKFQEQMLRQPNDLTRSTKTHPLNPPH
jgi:hypothetical protein